MVHNPSQEALFLDVSKARSSLFGKRRSYAAKVNAAYVAAVFAAKLNTSNGTGQIVRTSPPIEEDFGRNQVSSEIHPLAALTVLQRYQRDQPGQGSIESSAQAF
jgi:hypothetical protein